MDIKKGTWIFSYCVGHVGLHSYNDRKGYNKSMFFYKSFSSDGAMTLQTVQQENMADIMTAFLKAQIFFCHALYRINTR